MFLGKKFVVTCPFLQKLNFCQGDLKILMVSIAREIESLRQNLKEHVDCQREFTLTKGHLTNHTHGGFLPLLTPANL